MLYSRGAKVAVSLSLALWLAGCSSDLTGPPKSNEGSDPAPAARKPFVDLTQKFGDALLAQDFAAAYALTSSHVQQRMTLEQFRELNQKKWAEHTAEFKPTKCTVDIGHVGGTEIHDEIYAKLDQVPVAVRRAWTGAEFPLEIEDGEVTRCFECWLLIVEEGGNNLVGNFEYHWCD